MTDKQISEYISAPSTQEAIRTALAAIIAIPSVAVEGEAPYVFGVNAAAALDKMLEIGRNAGFRTENHDYYCGSILMDGADPDDEIGIIAHMDVVPAVEGWQFPRYALTVQDGLYIGRGVRDDKGPAVSALTAMKFFKDNNIKLPFTVRLLLGSDEERGMGDLPHYLESHKAPRFSFSPDSEFPVCVGEKGIAEAEVDLGELDGGLLALTGGNVTNSVADRAEAVLAPELTDAINALPLPASITAELRGDNTVLTAIGKSAHAAHPEGSINAIVMLAGWLKDSGLFAADSKTVKALTWLCESLPDNYGTGLDMACSDEGTGKLTCVCGLALMRDGHLWANYNIRYPASLTFEPLFAKMSAVAAKGGYEAKFISGSRGYVFSPDKPEIAALTAAFASVTGKEAEPYTMGGGTYARAFPNTVAFGAEFSERQTALGDGRGGAHERDECVRIADMNTAIHVFIRSLLNLAGLE